MNNKNNKLNYIKNLIREQVQLEFKRKNNFLNEQELGNNEIELVFNSSENGGSFFIKDVSKRQNLLSKYKYLNLTGFRRFKGDNTVGTPNLIEFVINLNDYKYKVTKNDFVVSYNDQTKTINVDFKNLSVGGVINLITPKGMKVRHDMRY